MQLQRALELGAFGRVPAQHRQPAQRVDFLGALVTEHLYEGRIDLQHASVGGALVDALEHAVVEAAEFGFAGAQRLLAAPTFYGDACQACRVGHQIDITRERRTCLRTIDGYGTEYTTVGSLDRDGPGSAKSDLQRKFAPA